MPSQRHEILVELFRRRPDLLAALLAPGDGALMPGAPGAVLEHAPDDVAVIHHEHYRADLVLRCTLPGRTRPVHAFVVEVQLARDPDKRFSWPLYVVGVAARERCPVTLVVIAVDQRIARWAAALALGSGSTVLTPVVIGPDRIPRVTEPAPARALPELAVLSVAAHGHAPGAEHIAHAAIAACAALDSRQRTAYVDFVLTCLSPEARHALEVLMPPLDLIPLSDMGRRFYGRGRKLGRDEGRKLGRDEGQRDLLITLLTRRFGPLPEPVVSRIRAAAPDRITHWGERLLSASSLDDIFTDATDAT